MIVLGTCPDPHAPSPAIVMSEKVRVSLNWQDRLKVQPVSLLPLWVKIGPFACCVSAFDRPSSRPPGMLTYPALSRLMLLLQW